jgi:hypothetical protein
VRDGAATVHASTCRSDERPSATTAMISSRGSCPITLLGMRRDCEWIDDDAQSRVFVQLAAVMGASLAWGGSLERQPPAGTSGATCIRRASRPARRRTGVRGTSPRNRRHSGPAWRGVHTGPPTRDRGHAGRCWRASERRHRLPRRNSPRCSSPEGRSSLATGMPSVAHHLRSSLQMSCAARCYDVTAAQRRLHLGVSCWFAPTDRAQPSRNSP